MRLDTEIETKEDQEFETETETETRGSRLRLVLRLPDLGKNAESPTTGYQFLTKRP